MFQGFLDVVALVSSPAATIKKPAADSSAAGFFFFGACIAQPRETNAVASDIPTASANTPSITDPAR